MTNMCDISLRRGRAAARSGFTLVEVLIAVSLLGLLAAGSIWTLSQANSYAALSRLNTGAQVAAQNQIDLIMSTGPFNPQNNEFGALPAEVLKPRGATPLTENILIYIEPDQSNPVYATRVTTVAKDASLVASGASARDLNLYYASVAVTYTYRGKTHLVQLHALRSPDSDGA
jgi:prepilin-type N-terminal cleavage/methylation domain-containing protein